MSNLAVSINFSVENVPFPLPSAGMVAVLQEFCPYVYKRDVYNYPVHYDSR